MLTVKQEIKIRLNRVQKFELRCWKALRKSQIVRSSNLSLFPHRLFAALIVPVFSGGCPRERDGHVRPKSPERTASRWELLHTLQGNSFPCCSGSSAGRQGAFSSPFWSDFEFRGVGKLRAVLSHYLSPLPTPFSFPRYSSSRSKLNLQPCLLFYPIAPGSPLFITPTCNFTFARFEPFSLLQSVTGHENPPGICIDWLDLIALSFQVLPGLPKKPNLRTSHF